MSSKDKGGSAPTEAANTLQSKAVARILDLVSEGEIVGLYTGEGADGKKFPFKAIYFDNVPVQSADGDFIDATLPDPELNAFANLTKLNFDGVEMWERLGTPNQAVISEFSEIESEKTINLQVTDASPVLFVIADDDVDAIRIKLRLPSLRTVNSKGSLVGTTLEYTIEYQPAGGSFTELDGFPDTVSGKNTSPYERQILVDLADKGLFPITFRVKRVTADSDKATLQNDLFVNGYTEIQRAQLIYPDSAILAFRVNSELFSGRVPRRSFLVRGLKIQVPSNYFPETRKYERNVTTGVDEGTPQAWDGLFYTAWSNNPAWVLYDILTNSRYGLGEFIDGDTQVDRFSLYDIGVYCDEDVDDGLGTGLMEARYSFNGVINTREDAFDVINAITSTFRGMSFWSAAGVTAVADSPKDPKRLVTRANVVNGHFVYSGTALRAQHTAAIVGYNDPTNHYKITSEVVEDASRREQFGWRELEVAAFGTTSRGQAYRLGRWIIDSEKNESELVSFTSGLELADLRPGDIIQIADPARQAVRRGGRIILHTAGTPDTIELDAPIQPFDGDDILVNNVLGGIETLALEGENDETTTVTLKTGVTPTASLQVNSIFIHRGPNLVPEEWRVLSMRETEEHTFEFSCLAYDATKFARIEENVILDPAPDTFLPSGPLVAATNLTFFESLYKVGSAVNVKLDISWTRSTDPRVHLYRVETRYRETTSEPVTAWELQEVTPSIHAEIPDARAGLWSFRITASRSNNDFSPGIEIIDQVVIGKTAPPPNVENLTAVRGFVEVVLDWDDVDDIDLSGYVVQRGPAWSDDPDNDPSVEVLADPVFASTFTATAKTVDTKRYHVRAIDTLGNLSREVTSVETSIQALPAVANLYAHQIDDSLRVDWDATAVVENIQYEIKYGVTTGTFDEATSLATVANSNYIGPLPVDAVQDQRIYVRPFVALATGNISYGIATYIDAQLYPLNRGFRVKSQTEETAWSSNVIGAATGWLAHNRGADFIVPDGTSFDVNYDYSAIPEMSNVATPTFHCNMTVNSVGTAKGLVFGAGSVTSHGMLVCFDNVGNLIIRAGTTEPNLASPTDATSMFGQWNLFETAGDRLDEFASNDLAVTGAVTGVTLFNTTDQGIGAKFETGGAYLTGSGPTLAGSDWTVCFQYDFYDSYNYEGAVLEINGTLQVVLADDGESIQIEIQHDDGGGFNTETLLDHSPPEGFDSEGYSAVEAGMPSLGRVIIWYVESTKTLSVMVANDDRDYDNDYGSWSVGSVVLTGSVVDLGLGTLYVGSRVPTFGQDDFEGMLSRLMILKRAPADFDERWELLHHIAPVQSPRLVIPAASVPKDTPVDLVWKLYKGDRSTECSIDAWLNGTLYQQADPYGCKMPGSRDYPGYTTGGSTSDNGWIRVGTDNANYNKTWLSIFEGESGSFDTATNSVVTINSPLSYWRDENVTAATEVISGELTLAVGSTYGRYEFPFNLPNERIGRLWFEMTATSIAAAPLKIFDALMTIFSTGAHDGSPGTEIAESTSFDPSIEVWIDIENTGTYIPLVAGTYKFKDSTIRVLLTRGENETTRPSITNFSTHFIEQPADITLQADTTDATTTTLTYDGGAVSATNIPVIPDDFMGHVTGRMIAWKDDNVDYAEYNFTAVVRRATGVASTTIASFSITEEETDTTWLVELNANTTHGGLNVNVTGVAGTNIKWLCDIDIVRVIGSDA